jgi:hypothetical protein
MDLGTALETPNSFRNFYRDSQRNLDLHIMPLLLLELEKSRTELMICRQSNPLIGLRADSLSPDLDMACLFAGFNICRIACRTKSSDELRQIL